jgi:hypothetical protein
VLLPVEVHPQNPEHRHGQHLSPNSWANQCRAALPAPACPNAREALADLEHQRDRVAPGCLHAPATHWSWSESRFVAMAARPAVDAQARPPVRELLDVPECQLECANQ